MNISIEIIGLTISTIGELLLAGTVLSVHSKLKQEHKVDKAVASQISLEQALGLIAILFIIAGYLFQIDFFSQLRPQ